MLIRIHPDNPPEREIRKVVDILKSGGIIIFPTDTVYALGCDIYNQKAVEKVARLKGLKIEKANFSLICYDLSSLSEYAKHVPNNVFKAMRKNLPGPFTFILLASSNVPRIFKHKKKTIGIRIPDNNIPLEIVKELGNPLITTSLHAEDEVIDYITDPELLHEKFEKHVDAVIDGGFGNNEPSTVLDCSGDDIEIIREGLGELQY